MQLCYPRTHEPARVCRVSFATPCCIPVGSAHMPRVAHASHMRCRALGDFGRAEAALLAATRASGHGFSGHDSTGADASRSSWLLLGDLYALNSSNAAAIDAYRNALARTEPCDASAQPVRAAVAKLLAAERRGPEAMALAAEMTLDTCDRESRGGDHETQQVLLQPHRVVATHKLSCNYNWWIRHGCNNRWWQRCCSSSTVSPQRCASGRCAQGVVGGPWLMRVRN